VTAWWRLRRAVKKWRHAGAASGVAAQNNLQQTFIRLHEIGRLAASHQLPARHQQRRQNGYGRLAAKAKNIWRPRRGGSPPRHSGGTKSA